MKPRFLLLTLWCAGLIWAASTKQDVAQRIQRAARIFDEINSGKGIPRQVLERAQCIGIVPGFKAGVQTSESPFQKGVVVCRCVNNTGWTAPSAVRMEGAGPGSENSTWRPDVVFVVLNRAGAAGMMQDQFTIPGSAGSGPFRPQIRYFSRTGGVMSGVALTGSTLRPDTEDNHAMYGRRAGAREILAGKVRPPLSAGPLYVALNNHVPPHKSLER